MSNLGSLLLITKILNDSKIQPLLPKRDGDKNKYFYPTIEIGTDNFYLLNYKSLYAKMMQLKGTNDKFLSEDDKGEIKGMKTFKFIDSTQYTGDQIQNIFSNLHIEDMIDKDLNVVWPI